MMKQQGKELKKMQHPRLGLIIAFNHDKEYTETTYYRFTGKVEEVPHTLQDCVEKVDQLIQVQIKDERLLRSLTYPSQKPQVKA